MNSIYQYTDEDQDKFYVEHRSTDKRDLYVSGGAFVPYDEVIKLRDALTRHVEEHKRELPRSGAIQFAGGEVAVWREDIKGWSVTGYERAWGDPKVLETKFGQSWTVLEARA